MLDRSAVEEKGKIVSESKNTYTVEKEDGTVVYVCKYCGKELEHRELIPHFNPKANNRCPQYPEIEAREESNAKEKEKPKKTERSLTETRKILTPEEEMLEEMCNVLYTQMVATPGIGESDKTEWFVNVYFRNNKLLQERPQELFKALRRHFPKADDDAISWIVSAVTKVRESYSKSLNLQQTYPFPQTGGFGTFSQPGITASQPAPQSQFDNIITFVFTMMQQTMQQQQQFYQMLLEEARSKPDPNAIRAQVENEYLRQQIERLEEQLNRMSELLAENNKARGISPEGWKDDYARLVAEMGEKILNLGERIIVENKKFRQTLVKYLAPKLLGTDKEKVEYEPSGEGRTDEEIIRKLEEEGLVEE